LEQKESQPISAGDNHAKTLIPCDPHATRNTAEVVSVCINRIDEFGKEKEEPG
jgi:hypothetical protein